ncbi:MAG: hypothetical protein R3F59_20385 [Myxococcota bacterium]
MDDAARVRVGQRVEHLQQQVRQLPPVEVAVQVVDGAVGELHREPRRAGAELAVGGALLLGLDHAGVVDAHDVRVVERADRADLGLQRRRRVEPRARRAEARRLGADDLDGRRDPAAVDRAPHRPHPAVGERFGELERPHRDRFHRASIVEVRLPAGGESQRPGRRP